MKTSIATSTALAVILLLSLSLESHSQQVKNKDLRTLIETAKIENLPPEKNSEIVNSTSDMIVGNDGKRYIVTKTKIERTKHFEDIVTFDPNVDALYPGAIIQGKTLQQGILTPINLPRNPIDLTLTQMSDPSINTSMRVKNPSLRNVNDVLNKFINRPYSAQQAKYTFTSTNVENIEQAMFDLGASISWMNGAVSGSFSKTSSNYSTHLMVRFVQPYYSVSCNAPSNPGSFFSNKTSLRDAEVYIKEDNAPAYISSVTYGREIWMLIESNHSEQEVNAAVHADFNALFANGNIDVDDKSKSVLNESSFQVLVLGGNPTDAIGITRGDHFNELNQYLQEGSRFSTKSPGVIISYTARYLKDNSVATVSSTAQNVLESMNRETVKVKRVKLIVHTTNDDREGGWIHVNVFQNGKLLFSHDDGEKTWNPGAWNDIDFNTDINASTGDPLTVQLEFHEGNEVNVSWTFDTEVQVYKEDGNFVKVNHNGNLLNATNQRSQYLNSDFILSK